MEDVESLRLRVKQSLIEQKCSYAPATGGGKTLDLLPELLALAKQKAKVDFRRFLNEANGLGRKQKKALECVGFIFSEMGNSYATPRSTVCPSKKNPKIIKEAIVSFKDNTAPL